MASKRQVAADHKAQSKALAKRQELLAPIQQQQYQVAELEKLRSNSTSPDMSASLKLCRTLLQMGNDAGATPRQQAELLKVFVATCRVQVAILVSMALLREDSSIGDFGRAVVECARETLRLQAPENEDEGAAYLESQLVQILDRANLVRVNAEYSSDMPALPNSQQYDAGDYQPVYDRASTSVDPAAELQLCRWYVQQAFDDRDFGAMILLMKQEANMALLRVQVGKSSGALLSVEAAQAATHAILSVLSDTLKQFTPHFETAIDDCRERVMSQFQPQEQQ